MTCIVVQPGPECDIAIYVGRGRRPTPALFCICILLKPLENYH